MSGNKKFDDIDPQKIIEEMREEYWKSVSEAEEEVDEDSVQVLSIEVSGELFFLDAKSCRSIIKAIRVTRVPRMPDYILGVINLRGEILSIVDIAFLFGLKKNEEPEKPRLVLVENGDVRLNFLVDKVVGVEWVETSRIGEPETMSTQLKDEYVKGHVAPLEEGGKWGVYLDLEKLINGPELSFTK